MATKETKVPRDSERGEKGKVTEETAKVSAHDVPVPATASPMRSPYPAPGSKVETPHVKAVREMLFGDMPVI